MLTLIEWFNLCGRFWFTSSCFFLVFAGMVRDLILGSAHMAISALSTSSERSREIDYSVPFQQSGVSCLAHAQQDGAVPLTAFLVPFRWVLLTIFEETHKLHTNLQMYYFWNFAASLFLSSISYHKFSQTSIQKIKAILFQNKRWKVSTFSNLDNSREMAVGKSFNFFNFSTRLNSNLINNLKNK